MWPEKEIQAFASEVAEGLVNVGTKGKRLSLSALVALLDNISDQIRQDHDLQEPLTNLKEFTRLPRQNKVEELLKRLQTLADQAIAAHCLAATEPQGSQKTVPPPSPKEEKQQEERTTSQGKTKALAKWPKTFVNSFKERLQEQADLAKNQADTKVHKAKVIELAKLVPAEVALYYPMMMAAVSTVESEPDAAGLVENSVAQTVFEQLGIVARDASETKTENAAPL